MKFSSISVLVRALNESEHLEKLVESINNQNVAPDQMVLVDSGSTDGTIELAKKLGFEVVHIKKEDFSFGRSLNMGVLHCRGELIVNLSAHVHPVEKTFIEDLARAFEDPDVGFAYTRQQGNQDSAFSELMIMDKWYPVGQIHQVTSLPFANNASSAFMRSTWQNLMFDEMLPGLEDIDFCRKLIARGMNVTYVPTVSIIHIHNENWLKVKNRYRREAIALRAIFQGSRLGLLDSLSLFIGNVISDCNELLRGNLRVFSTKELVGILRFRSAQFVGAYLGGRYKGEASSELIRKMYHP